MKTLDEAVAELEAMEDPREVLDRYDNSTVNFRCSSCPVASFLLARTGKLWWVTASGAVYPTLQQKTETGNSYDRMADCVGVGRAQFSTKISAVIDLYDRSAR